MTSKDIQVGAIFGRWKVLEINTVNPNSKAKHPPKMALCECQCENKTKRYKEYRDLYSGRSLSCGCLRNEQTAIRNKNNSSIKIGNRYGHLEVIEDLGYRQQSRGKNESWYRCLCHHCGNEKFEVNGNNLQSGNTTSCGCVNSRGENLIQQILQQNNINFSKEYSFSDFKTDKGYVYRFDFAVFKDNKLDYLIEFDGRQHFEGPNAKWTESYSKEEIQFKDNQKNKYCKEHNIKLKRIPYYDINKITLQTLQDDTFTV